MFGHIPITLCTLVKPSWVPPSMPLLFPSATPHRCCTECLILVVTGWIVIYPPTAVLLERRLSSSAFSLAATTAQGTKRAAYVSVPSPNLSPGSSSVTQGREQSAALHLLENVWQRIRGNSVQRGKCAMKIHRAIDSNRHYSLPQGGGEKYIFAGIP